MGKLSRNIIPLVFACSSGFLFTLAMAPHGIWVEYFLGLTILIGAALSHRSSAALLLGLISGITFFAPTIWWVYVSTSTLVAWILLTLIQALYFGIFALLTRWTIFLPRWSIPISVGVIWAAIEQIRCSWPLTGFPWGTTAEGTFDSIFSQLLPIGSTPLVAFTVAAFACLCALLALQLPPITNIDNSKRLRVTPRRYRHSRRLIGGATSIALTVMLFVGGLWFNPQYQPQDGSQRVKIGLVQGGVEQPWRQTFAQKTKVSAATLQTLESGRKHDPAEIYLTGETSLDRDPRQDIQTSLLLHELISGSEPVLLGVNNFFVDTASKLYRYNQIVIWQQGKIKQNTYSKRYPVPYGEYIPFRNIAAYFADLDSLLETEVVPGINPPNLEVNLSNQKKINIAIGICFEVAFREAIAEAVRGGGEFIYIPTNNSSFENTSESHQQIKILQVRAKETSRYGVQVSINGESALVDPNGKVLKRTGLNESDYFTAEVELKHQLTPAVKFSKQIYYVTFMLAGVVVAFILGMYLRVLRKQNTRKTKI